MFIISEDGRNFVKADAIKGLTIVKQQYDIKCIEAVCDGRIFTMANDLNETDAIELCYMLARAIEDPLCKSKYHMLRIGSEEHMKFLRRNYGLKSAWKEAA